MASGSPNVIFVLTGSKVRLGVLEIKIRGSLDGFRATLAFHQ